MQDIFSKGYNQLLVTLIFVGVLAALGAYVHATLKEAEYMYMGPTTISVAGEGEVLAKPDIGQFSFAVRAEGDTADAAQTESAEAINEILGYLEAAGVAENDIKITSYRLDPQYTYEERVCSANGFCPPGERTVSGYEVYQNIEVKVRDLEKAGELISGAGERGATNISGLTFTIDDDSLLQAQAREAAIKDAKEKASALAEDLGVRLVRMNGFWEENNRPMPYGYGGDMAMEESAMQRASVAPELPTGENTITSRVNISYVVE